MVHSIADGVWEFVGGKIPLKTGVLRKVRG